MPEPGSESSEEFRFIRLDKPSEVSDTSGTKEAADVIVPKGEVSGVTLTELDTSTDDAEKVLSKPENLLHMNRMPVDEFYRLDKDEVWNELRKYLRFPDTHRLRRRMRIVLDLLNLTQEQFMAKHPNATAVDLVKKDRLSIDSLDNETRGRSVTQELGVEITSKDGLKEAWQLADQLGEDMFVKLSDGRVMMVMEPSFDGSAQPVISCIHYKDIDDSGEDVKLPLVDGFLSLQPVVTDFYKTWEDVKE